jgi:hypothetical protein
MATGDYFDSGRFCGCHFFALNNIGMVQRREAVYTADKTGDNTVTQNRLYDLQRFVSSHMNTDMGKGVFLTATYNRDKQALIEKASTGPNGNIYVKAQQVCAPRYSSWSPAYVQCTVNELAKYPAGTSLNDSVNLPPGHISIITHHRYGRPILPVGPYWFV